MIRTGLGKDIHRLVKGRRFLLGGIELPADKGEIGHSDGDTLTHAVIDALLGASGLGDIGEFFPPDDPKWKDADSLLLLKIISEIINSVGWKIINIDCVVTCDKPHILPYRDAIREKLADVLDIDKNCIFLKGKTSEGFGNTGKKEFVEALAICLIEKN